MVFHLRRRLLVLHLEDDLLVDLVVEKVGFQREGELGNAYWTRGEWKNGYMYCITRQEWKGPRVFGRG